MWCDAFGANPPGKGTMKITCSQIVGEVKAVLRRRRTSVKQLFSLQASDALCGSWQAPLERLGEGACTSACKSYPKCVGLMNQRTCQRGFGFMKLESNTEKL